MVAGCQPGAVGRSGACDRHEPWRQWMAELVNAAVGAQVTTSCRAMATGERVAVAYPQWTGQSSMGIPGIFKVTGVCLQ